MMEDAIRRNRVRQHRLKRARKVLRAVRLRIFEYEDAGKLAKARRVIARCERVIKG